MVHADIFMKIKKKRGKKMFISNFFTFSHFYIISAPFAFLFLLNAASRDGSFLSLDLILGGILGWFRKFNYCY